MKFKIEKNKFNLFLISILILFNSPTLALTGDSEKPVNINSINQILDFKSNVATFTDKVILTQGSIKIIADKIVIIRLHGNINKIIIDAYGKPVKFYQVQDNGKIVQGNTKKLHYEPEKDFIELIGDAFIQEQDNNIKGDYITYLVNKQKMQAYSLNKTRHVTTVLVPLQLQYKHKPLQKINK